MSKIVIVAAVAIILVGCAGNPTLDQYIQAKQGVHDTARTIDCQRPYPEIRAMSAEAQRSYDVLCGVTSAPMESVAP